MNYQSNDSTNHDSSRNNDNNNDEGNLIVPSRVNDPIYLSNKLQLLRLSNELQLLIVRARQSSELAHQESTRRNNDDNNNEGNLAPSLALPGPVNRSGSEEIDRLVEALERFQLRVHAKKEFLQQEAEALLRHDMALPGPFDLECFLDGVPRILELAKASKYAGEASLDFCQVSLGAKCLADIAREAAKSGNQQEHLKVVQEQLKIANLVMNECSGGRFPITIHDANGDLRENIVDRLEACTSSIASVRAGVNAERAADYDWEVARLLKKMSQIIRQFNLKASSDAQIRNVLATLATLSRELAIFAEVPDCDETVYMGVPIHP